MVSYHSLSVAKFADFACFCVTVAMVRPVPASLPSVPVVVVYTSLTLNIACHCTSRHSFWLQNAKGLFTGEPAHVF